MSEWKEYELGELCSFQAGTAFPNNYQGEISGDYPFIKVSDMNLPGNERIIRYANNWISEKACRKLRAKIHPKDATVFAKIGVALTYNRRRLLKQPTIIDNNMMSAIPCDNVIPLFLYYLLCTLDFNDIASGTALPYINVDDLKKIHVKIPPLPEQRAIASVLSSLDDKIDLLHRENKTLEAMAETLFRQWFIEEAKDEWEEKSLKDIYIFEKGFEPGSENYLETEEEDAIRFIRVGDMLSHTPSVYIKKSLAKSICSADDLLMSFDGTPGRLNFGIEGAYSSGIRRIYSLNPVYDNLGLKYLIFKSKHIQDTVNAHSSGTVILHASSSIDELTFSFPDERKLEEFNEMITPIFSKMQLNKRQFRILEKLRDTLLPKLMSGEVRVKYVEEEMASCRA